MKNTISPAKNPQKTQSEIPGKKSKLRSFITVRFILLCFPLPLAVFSVVNPGCRRQQSETHPIYSFQIPPDYLMEASNIPSFWLSSCEEVNDFLIKTVHKGQIKVIGTSAGGRQIRAVLYGTPRQGKGTTTFSGSLGFGDARAYRGPDHNKTVYMSMAAVHGGEFEGIVGMVNLISVIETGKDLRGKDWPGITEAISELDRLILIPIVNPDGRQRIPLRMELYRDTIYTVPEYLNTGGLPDGTITGWPQVKEFIPMDFSKPGFPGGYPNDAGVNIQHDDFLGKKQPETQALLILQNAKSLILLLICIQAPYICGWTDLLESRLFTLHLTHFLNMFIQNLPLTDFRNQMIRRLRVIRPELPPVSIILMEP